MAVLALGAGCTSGTSSTPAASSTTIDAGPATAPVTSAAVEALTCSALKDARFDFEAGVSVMVGLTTPQAFAAIRSGEVAFDGDAVAAAIETLRRMDTLDTPVGDAGEALNDYAEALNLTRVALRADDPTSTDAYDALQVTLADSATFVSNRGAVNFAIGLVCEREFTASPTDG